MGTYVYGIGKASKNVIGLDAPVHKINYIYKPGYNGWQTPVGINRVLSRYENALYRGDLIVYDWSVGSIVFNIDGCYPYKSNTISDQMPWKEVGFLVKRGRSWAIAPMSEYKAFVEAKKNEVTV